jgi:hypothetical protein
VVVVVFVSPKMMKIWGHQYGHEFSVAMEVDTTLWNDV